MKAIIVAALLLAPIACYSQEERNAENNKEAAQKLQPATGEPEARASHSGDATALITTEDIELHDKLHAAGALNLLPGLLLTANGARNETMVNLRGFDMKYVPVLMDGIPVYIAYDGSTDLARFTTFGLSAIEVATGSASVLCGANAAGGVIDMRGRQPEKKLGYDGSLGMLNTDGYKGHINIGTRMGKFYFQGGYSILHTDLYSVSEQFDLSRLKDEKERENSFQTDGTLTLRVGWSPNKKNELAIGYINMQGSKGNPVYCGTDTLNPQYAHPQYLRWPMWDRETYYFIWNRELSSRSSVKTRLYYNLQKRTLRDYDDETYSTQNEGYAFSNYYNDYSYGGNVAYETRITDKNTLRAAVHYKEDIHREHYNTQPVQHFKDNTISAGIEDTYALTGRLALVPGVSFNVNKNTAAEDYDINTNKVCDFATATAHYSWNGQLSATYKLSEEQRIGCSASQKTRFATMADRYGYIWGTTIANPGLNPETINNYELRYTGEFSKKLMAQSAVFYSRLTDVITNERDAATGMLQMRNAGRAEYKGLAAQLRYELSEHLLAGAGYTYVERRNLSDPALHLTGAPNTKIAGYAQYKPCKLFHALLSTEYNSSRFSTSYGARTDGFTLLNTVISSQIMKRMSIEAGMNNIFDTNYSLVEGYPMEGREFFVTLKFFSPE